MQPWVRRILGVLLLLAGTGLVAMTEQGLLDNRHASDRHGGPIVDLGSGAGFPGLVLAILGAPDVHLVEADSRKAAFLREAARATATPVTVHAARIEAVSLTAPVVTARALAPLATLLHYGARILAPGEPSSRAVFLKGARWQAEVAEAAATWHFTCESVPSRTDPDGAILILESIRHA